MKRLYPLALLLLLFLVACTAEQADEVAVPEISDPTLFMFYTDN